MTRVSARSVFGCDYTNLEQVKLLALRMGKGMTVFKHPTRTNYNICHTSRTDLLKGMKVIYQT